MAAWSQGGNILVRKNEDDPPTQVYTHGDLAEIKLNQDEDGNFTNDSAGEPSDSDAVSIDSDY